MGCGWSACRLPLSKTLISNRSRGSFLYEVRQLINANVEEGASALVQTHDGFSDGCRTSHLCSDASSIASIGDKI